jgi:hypothetical protein
MSATSLDRVIPTSIGPSTLEAAASMLERGHGLQRMGAMSLAEGRALRRHHKRRHAKRHSSSATTGLQRMDAMSLAEGRKLRSSYRQ